MTQEELLQQQLMGTPTSAAAQMRQFNTVNPAQYAAGGPVDWQDWMNQTLEGSVPSSTYQAPLYGGMDQSTFAGMPASAPTTYQYPAYGGMPEDVFNWTAPRVSGGQLIQPERQAPIQFEAPLPFTTPAPTPDFGTPNVPTENVFADAIALADTAPETNPFIAPVAPVAPPTPVAPPPPAPPPPAPVYTPPSAPVPQAPAPIYAPQPVVDQGRIDAERAAEEARLVAQENQRIEAIRVAEENAQAAEQERIAERAG